MNRRFFLRATAAAGGGLMLGLYQQPEVKAQGFPGGGQPLLPSDFITIAPDGTATIVGRTRNWDKGRLTCFR